MKQEALRTRRLAAGRRFSRFSRLALPAALLALPLLFAQQEGAAPPEGDDGGGEGVNTDVMRVRGVRPLVRHPSQPSVGSATRPRRWPFLAARDDGRVELGNLAWEPGVGDRVELRALAAADAKQDAKAESNARIANATAGEIVRPVAAVDLDGALWVAWTQLVDGRAQLVATREEAGSFVEPKALTSGAGANLNPELCFHRDAAGAAIWIAWEGDVADASGAPRRVALAAPLQRDLALGAVVRASDAGGGSAVDVTIASGGGALWCAWSEWGRDDYEIVARKLDAAGAAPGARLVVSHDARADDSHPALAVAADGAPWIAWDRVEIAARGESAPRKVSVRQHDATIDVQVRVASLRDGAVVVPKSGAADVPDGMVAGAPMMTTGGGMPRVALDGAGRLWIAYRWLEQREGMRKFGFPLIVQSLRADGWSEPLAIDDSVGSGEEAAIAALPDGGVAVAFACDDRATLTARERRNPSPKLIAGLVNRGVTSSRWNGIESIAVARFHADGDAAAPPLVAPAPPLPPREPVSPNDLDDPYVTGAKRFEVVRGDERFEVWWGDLHRHSNVSRCSAGLEPGPADRYAQARDVHRCDFFALTDHSGAISPADWWLMDKLGWLYGSDRFVTLAGFEWSTSQYGHHNVILPDRLSLLVPPDLSLETLYKGVGRNGAITIPHHPSHRQFPNDFAPVDDRFTRLVELFQACRGNFEFDGCFRQSNSASALGGFVHDALDHGHQFGLIASTDHSYGQSYACALAPTLDRKALFEALQARRTYGATAKGLFVDLRVDGALMGEAIERSRDLPLPITLTVRSTKELVDVVLFKDGRIFQSLRGDAPAVPATTLAPLRLVARVAPGGKSIEAWRVTLAGPELVFGTVEELRAKPRRKNAPPEPEWSAASGEAELRVPAGYAPSAAVTLPLHLWAAGSAEIAVKGASGEEKTSVAALAAAPRTFTLAGLGDLTLALECGDAAVDLTKGLGTRELTREWSDTAPRERDSWYYARLIQADGEMAWSSPVFVTLPE